jgi:hypothetical protein
VTPKKTTNLQPKRAKTHHQKHRKIHPQHKPTIKPIDNTTTILGPKIHHQTHLKEDEIFCGNEESLRQAHLIFLIPKSTIQRIKHQK